MGLSDFLLESSFWGVFLSLLAYGAGCLLKKKIKLAIFNPLLVAIVLVTAFLLIFRLDETVYRESAGPLSYFLTPATVCLAVPLYRQFELLKKNWTALLFGILSGVSTSLLGISLLAVLFGFSRSEWITFLPKSVTTAIGMGISEELGGYVSITVAVIIVTGILGNMLAEPVCRLFRITNPIAKGVAVGSASHAIGTAKAMEMGETEGAMSSLSIVVSGILTVIGASVLVHLF